MRINRLNIVQMYVYVMRNTLFKPLSALYSFNTADIMNASRKLETKGKLEAAHAVTWNQSELRSVLEEDIS